MITRDEVLRLSTIDQITLLLDALEEIKRLRAQRDQAVKALRYYAEPENWTDFASEEMEPEDFPAWTAEVNLPAKSLFILGDTDGWDTDGWTIAKAAIAATEDE